MLDVLKFIFGLIIEYIRMLFTIDVGFTNLGTLMCIVYIFLPVILVIINFIKVQLIEELDDAYDIRHRKYNVFSGGNKRRKGYVGKHEKKGYVGKHEKKSFFRRF